MSFICHEVGYVTCLFIRHEVGYVMFYNCPAVTTCMPDMQNRYAILK